jgi:hypothetical protein
MTAMLPDSARPARLARMLTGELVAEAADAQASWDAAVRSLRGLSAEDQVRLLRAFAALAESYLGAVEAARRLWAEVGELGGTVEATEEVAAAGRVFEKMRQEATRAVEHRQHPWQPKDPERYERALQGVREGRVVAQEEARKWFRPDPEGGSR